MATDPIGSEDLSAPRSLFRGSSVMGGKYPPKSPKTAADVSGAESFLEPHFRSKDRRNMHIALSDRDRQAPHFAAPEYSVVAHSTRRYPYPAIALAIEPVRRGPAARIAPALAFYPEESPV